MRLLRFYVNIPLKINQDAELPEPVARHMVRVLRLQAGAQVTFFNGDGNEYSAEIISASKKAVIARVLDKKFVDRESNIKIHLVQALSKGDRMEATIQKAVELGVHQITPVSSERSNVTLTGDRLLKKMAHWAGVIESACGQTGRNYIPKLNKLCSLSSCFAALGDKTATKLMLNPYASIGLASLEDEINEVILLVGPEGGFSDVEVECGESFGFKPVKMGPRILRTETAGGAMISMLQLKFGDMG